MSFKGDKIMWKRLSLVLLIAALVAAALPFSVAAQEEDWVIEQFEQPTA